MNFIEASVFILVIASLSVPLATRFRVPLEIFLIAGSCLISFLSGASVLKIDPMIVFNLFLPPILFSAAYVTSWRDFKANIRPISLLAFGLVLFTLFAVAYTVHTMIPGMSWGVACLLGAIVSPSDASAAAAIIRKLGVSRRFTAIVEGESLINDATALTLYRFSLASVLYGSFSLADASMVFLELVLGGALLGLVCGMAANLILRRLHDAQAETTFTIILAFATYYIAEHLDVSGVIATVVCGIYFGLSFPEYASSQTRIIGRSTWQVVLFMINGFVFSLIGMQLPWVLKGLEMYSMQELIAYGLITSLVVIAVRVVWVFPAAIIPRALFANIRRRDPLPSHSFIFAVGWTGMRGIISLAAALSIPVQLASGDPFPYRDLLIFLTYCVVVVTLLVPTLSFPFFTKWFNFAETEDTLKEEAVARVYALESALIRVDKVAAREEIPEEVVTELHNQLERNLNVLKTQIGDVPYSTLNNAFLQYKKLVLSALEAERATLISMRRKGNIHDEIFHLLAGELDLEEIRARGIRL